jgi:hypothetical protein
MSTTTATKERPILFSASMVRAILNDQKTQTRRVVKMPPDFEQFTHLRSAQGAEAPKNTFIAYWLEHGEEEGGGTFFRCPYGNPGDRLWVREAWAVQHEYDAAAPSEIGASARWHYAATENLGGLRKRPSIFLPRRGSRILLKITAIRVERLQSISDADALAEGCSADDMKHGDSLSGVYARLWQSINGPGSWKANPWVWVVEFRRVQP